MVRDDRSIPCRGAGVDDRYEHPLTDCVDEVLDRRSFDGYGRERIVQRLEQPRDGLKGRAVGRGDFGCQDVDVSCPRGA